MHQQPNGHPTDDPQLLYVTLILDETGSMQSCKAPAIAGFNEYIGTLRREPAETRFTLTLFNSSRTEVRHHAVPISAVQELNVDTYRPRNTTPLYDAIGRTLTAARQEAPADAKKLCVILTDGLENASSEYTRKQVFDLIKRCEKEGWTFLYLGADHDVWAAGESLGVAHDNTVSFCKSKIGDTFSSLSLATARYRRGDRKPAKPARYSDDPSSAQSPDGHVQ